MGGDDDLEGAGDRVGAVHAERPAQQHRGLPVPHGHGDELPGRGLREHGVGEDEVRVGAERLGDDDRARGPAPAGRAAAGAAAGAHVWDSRSTEMSRACCCRLATAKPPSAMASIPCTAAASCWTVVMIGASTVVVAARMS